MSRQGVKKREKRLKRIFGVSTIILSLLIAFIPNFVYAATDSGDNQGIHWDVSGDTLTISAVTNPGTGITAGEIPDFTSGSLPWATHSNAISNIIIQNTVTDLGPNFPSNLGVSSISSLTINGPAAIQSNSINLSGMTLDTLTFGEGITSIPSGAVKNPAKITRLVLPATLTSLDEGNFYNTQAGTRYYNIGEIVTPTASEGENFLKNVNYKIMDGTYKNTYTSGYTNTFIACYHQSGTGAQREPKVYIKDRRTSPLNKELVSAQMANSNVGDYILEINDIDSSDKDSMQNLIKKTVKESMFFDLKLTDSIGNTSQNTVNITIPYPASWNDGTVQAVYTYLSVLEPAPTTPVTGSSVNMVTITADHFSPYALTYTENSQENTNNNNNNNNNNSSSTDNNNNNNSSSTDNNNNNNSSSANNNNNSSANNNNNSSSANNNNNSSSANNNNSSSANNNNSSSSNNNSNTNNSSSSNKSKKSSSSQEKTYTITVKDERTDKTDSRYISAKVTKLNENLVLRVKDSDGTEIQKSLVVPNKGIVKYVDLDLQNEKGDGVVDYGTCTVVLPIPQEMDLTKGSVKVMAFNADNALKEISSKIVEVSGKKCVRFNPPHFSEFALVYTPFSGNTANGNGGNTGNKTATGNKVIMPKTGGGDEIRYILSAFLFLFGTVQLITSVTRKKSTVR